MKNLPLGIQEFSKLREQDLLYIDKTNLIYKLLTQGSYYFLSRPRRFGKSLLVNTLKEIFLGNKDYFKGLWIEDKIDWHRYPVVQIDFSNIGSAEIGLWEALIQKMRELAKDHRVQLNSQTPGLMFRELIISLFNQNNTQVVLLIDEYDKPIVDYLDDVPKAEQNRDLLKNFYSIIKGSDKYLKFVFLTGVSKFAKVSIFSDLNNISDISTSSKFAKIVGYTQEELETYFAERINLMRDILGMDRIQLLSEIKRWYNGYSWNGKDYLYNPYSILSFFQNEQFKNYWFATGTPTFLTKLLKKGFMYEFKNLKANLNSFDTSNLNDLDYVLVLFQTGYLTFKESLGYDMFALDYPNSEVRDSFNQYLLAEYAQLQPGRMQPMIYTLFQALRSDDFEEVKTIFNALFASVPNDYFIENREKFYHAIVFLSLRLLGYFTEIEINSGRGRLDCVVFLEDKIFLFEFKLDQSAESALKQIKDKQHFGSFQGQGKNIYLVGVNMKSALKEMDDFLVEKI